MAGKELEVITPLLENILNQGAALRAVRLYQSGSGIAALEAAAGLIRAKRRVVLSGMGASLFGCMTAQLAMAAAGLDVSVIETAELLHFDPVTFDRDTAVVLVSRSGESVEVTKLLPRLKASGAAIIGLANVPRSTLGDAADVTITLGSPADQMVAVQTYTATVVVLRLLCDILGGQGTHAFADLEKAETIAAEWLPQVASASARWRHYLPDAGPLYVLGRGSSLGSVAESVLLMHETAKASAVGMSVAQFRHGPVEVVDKNFRAVLFGTQAQTADLDAALVADIGAMGGDIQWIGPAPSSKHSTLVSWPSHPPERFNSVFEIMPIQLLAYRWAEWRGVQPGEFRWAPLVTNTESGFRVSHTR